MLEVALLDIRSGAESAFESAMAEAMPLIAVSPGFRGMEVRRCIESSNRYVLLVWWDRLEDHTIDFRGSDRYDLWREQLHHFYDPFPAVQHFGTAIHVAKDPTGQDRGLL